MTPSQQKYLDKHDIKQWKYNPVTRTIAYAKTDEVDGLIIEQIIVVGPRGGVRRNTRVNGGKWVS